MTETRDDPRIPDLVSLREAAAILGVGRAYAHRLVQAGQLRGRKVDTSWVFRRSVVEKLARGRQP